MSHWVIKVEGAEVSSLTTYVQQSFPIKAPNRFRAFFCKHRDKGWVEVQKVESSIERPLPGQWLLSSLYPLSHPFTQRIQLSCVYPQAGAGQLFSKDTGPSVRGNLGFLVKDLKTASFNHRRTILKSVLAITPPSPLADTEELLMQRELILVACPSLCSSYMTDHQKQPNLVTDKAILANKVMGGGGEATY